MDNYKLDFGRLAYVKTQDLAKRLQSMESKTADNYTGVYFRRENIPPNSAFNEKFTAAEKSDANFSVVINSEGGAEVTFTLDGVFLYSAQITTSGEKSLSFEARGISQGEKILSVSFLGGANILYCDITVSGNKLYYTDYHTCLAVCQIVSTHYILYLQDENLTLYKASEAPLEFVWAFEGQAKYCHMLSLGNKILVFYTVYGDTLYYSVYDTAAKTAAPPRALALDTQKFSAAAADGTVHLFYVSKGRFYYSCGCFAGGSIVFAAPQLADIHNVSEPYASSNNNKIYLISADSAGRAKLHISRRNSSPPPETLKIKIEAI